MEPARRGLTSNRFERGGSRGASVAARACARVPRASTAARPAAPKNRATAIRSPRPSVLDVAVLDLAIAGARTRQTSFSIERNPTVSREIRALVCHLARANPLWRALRIHGELAKLGIEISQRTVGRLLPRRGRPRSQWWRGFLENQVGVLASMDFFVVPTATFRALFVCSFWLTSPAASSISPSPTRRRLRGQRSKLPRRSHGKRLRGVSSEIATRPTAWSSASGSNEWASPR